MTIKQRGVLVNARVRLQKAEAKLKIMESTKTTLTEEMFTKVIQDLLHAVAKVRGIRIEIFEGKRAVAPRS